LVARWLDRTIIMGKEIYLVTGGAGFIGSHIVELLLKNGARVRVIDDFSTGREANLRNFLDDIDLIEGDIRNEELVNRAVSGCSYILHQAALPSVVRSLEDPVTTHQVNVVGTLNLLCAARQARTKRFVFASSSSVYGNSPVLPKREDMPPRPMSPYAVGKFTGENYCRIFSNLYDMRCVSLRYFNVFGPRQDPTSQYAAVIPNFFSALCRGESPLIDGDGDQTRDFTFVGNVAAANLLACGAEIEAGEVFNIACGARTSINELLRLIQGVLRVSQAPRHGRPRQGDVRDSLADISRARKRMDYNPDVDLREGLRITARYYRGEGGN
jgi:nucleoside-diphosphate-sugar epimerase